MLAEVNIAAPVNAGSYGTQKEPLFCSFSCWAECPCLSGLLLGPQVTQAKAHSLSVNKRVWSKLVNKHALRPGRWGEQGPGGSRRHEHPFNRSCSLQISKASGEKEAAACFWWEDAGR